MTRLQGRCQGHRYVQYALDIPQRFFRGRRYDLDALVAGRLIGGLFLSLLGAFDAARPGDIRGGKLDLLRAFPGAVGVMHDAVLVDPSIGLLGSHAPRHEQAEDEQNRAYFHAPSIAT